MLQAIAVISLLIVFGTLALLLANLRSGKHEFFSLRNVFLLGFAHFFGLGTYFTATMGAAGERYSPSESAWSVLLMAMPLFLAVFAVGNAVGKRCGWVAKVVPPLNLPVTSPGVLTAIVVLMTVALLGALLPPVGYIGVIFVQFRAGLIGCATGLATYYLLAKRFNPVALGVFAATFMTALLLGMVGEIGRRAMLGVLLAVGWMWYYYSLRTRSVSSNVFKIGMMGTAAFFAMVVYAGVRGGGSETAFDISTRAEQLGEMAANPRIEREAIMSTITSDAPLNTMFIIENYPDPYEYDAFNGLKWFIANPIPRYLWPEKPSGMGTKLQKQMDAAANLGVGIIGHGWSEGAWAGVVGYALFFGLLTGALDLLIRRRVWNPFFVAAMGSNLGNFIGLARGETAQFLLIFTAGVVGIVILLYGARAVLGGFMMAAPPLLTRVNAWAFAPPPDEGGAEEWLVGPDAAGSSTGGGEYLRASA